MRTLLRTLLIILVLAVATMPTVATTFLASPVVAGNDDNKGKDKGKEEKDNKGNKGKKDKKQVESTAGYTIEIDCDGDGDDDDSGEGSDEGDDNGDEGDDGNDNATTTCTFTAVEPDGGKKVNHVLIPAEVACADASGDVKWVDSDPQFNRAGYRYEGQKPFTVVFDDMVTTGGTATYWVKAANYILPATGPGLQCAGDDAQAAASSTPEPTAGPTESGGTLEPSPEPTAAPTETPAPTTGTILVTTYTCTGVTASSPDVDWFGACAQGGASTFSLAGGSDSLSMDTAEDGTATFADLAPSTYDLDDTTRTWCHAESDNVNTEGNVIVEAGLTTSVWLFYCE
jgi:hypothetical protein